MVFVRQDNFAIVKKLAPLCLTVLVVAGIVWGASKTQEQASVQALKLTEESVRRAAVQCYALEGIYPVNLEYLMDHYGIRPDFNRFIVHYQYIADNLLPVISVLPINR